MILSQSEVFWCHTYLKRRQKCTRYGNTDDDNSGGFDDGISAQKKLNGDDNTVTKSELKD